MRAEPDKLKTRIVQLAVDHDQVGPDVAVAVIGPLAAERVIEIPARPIAFSTAAAWFLVARRCGRARQNWQSSLIPFLLGCNVEQQDKNWKLSHILNGLKGISQPAISKVGWGAYGKSAVRA